VAKRNLLLVDADSRSLRVLEVSLRKAGYSVTSCASAEEALEFVELARPDLILSDTVLGDLDGFAFVERLRERKDLADVPLMFLSSDGSVESKVRGLELGVEDYLAKPIYIKEIITRVNLVLQRFERQGLERRSLTKTRFSGSLSEMGLVDLLQTIDISRKSGVLHLSHGDKRGAVFFDEGSLAHAELGSLRGEHAVYRFLVWNDGQFDLEFRPVRIGERTIQTSTQGLLMEGMRRVDEWGRMLEQLPPLDRIFEVDDASLVERLAEIPDELNDLLRLFDGQRSLMQVVDDRSTDDLATLESITKLYFEGLIVDSGRARDDDESFEEEALLPAPGRANADASSLSRASTVPSRAAPDDGNSSESEGSSSLFPEGTERAGPDVRSSAVPSPKGPALDAGPPPEPRKPESSSDALPSPEAMSEHTASETEPATSGHSGSSEPSNAAREVSEVPAKDVGSSAQSPKSTEARVGAAVPDSDSAGPADSDPADSDPADSDPADSTSENEAASADPEDEPSDEDEASSTAASEASMAKKGNRRRKRSKTRESIPESNVIQFPAQKAAAAEAALATVTTREDESGQHRVEAEREAERKQRLEEAAAKRAKAQQRRTDAEARRGDADVKKAEAEALRAEAEAKSAEAEAKRFDVKRAEAEVKKAEAELKKAEAQKDDAAASKARDAAQAKRDAAEAFAKEADALEAEAQSLGDGVGALERAAIALQNEAKDLIAAADALEAEATAIETAPPTVGVAVDADAEERASEPPKAKASEAPKAKASEPPKKAETKPESKPEARKSEPPKGKSEASKSEPPKKPDAKSKIKEARTSSSQTIKAITTSGEHAAVAEEFFTAKAYEAEIEHETWDDLELDKVVQGDTKWRRVTLGFVAAGVLVIGGYWLYHNVLMPTPVELSNTPSAPAMPDMSNVGTMEAETAEPTEAAEAPTAAEATDVAPSEAVAPTEEATEVAPTEETTEVAEAATEEAAAEPAPAAPGAAPGAYEALLEEARGTRNPRAKIAKLEEALAANPNGAEALEELGWIQLNRGQYAVAAELAQRASVLLPTSSKVWITLGAARQSLRDTEGAQAAYRSCVEQGQGQYVAECRRMAR
jgi:DNA-binding response OmpR family regulator